jgi:hypothetical protein
VTKENSIEIITLESGPETGLFLTTLDGQISKEKLPIEDSKFNCELSFSNLHDKVEMIFKIFLFLEQGSLYAYSSQSNSLPKTLSFGDYFFYGDNNIEMFHRNFVLPIEMNSKFKTKIVQDCTLGKIKEMFDETIPEEFENVRKDLATSSFFVNFSRYNIKDLGPAELKSLEKQDESFNENKFQVKLEELSKEKLDIKGYHNPGEDETIILGKELADKIRAFCETREQNESKSIRKYKNVNYPNLI